MRPLRSHNEFVEYPIPDVLEEKVNSLSEVQVKELEEVILALHPILQGWLPNWLTREMEIIGKTPLDILTEGQPGELKEFCNQMLQSLKHPEFS